MERPVPGRRRIVFLIDADESARVTHETILRTEGYDIMSAADAGQALSQLRDQPPDLLLIGPRLGRMSAMQLIRLVKEDAMLAGVGICVYGPQPMQDEIKAAGADAFLAVPVSGRELVREVAHRIGRA